MGSSVSRTSEFVSQPDENNNNNRTKNNNVRNTRKRNRRSNNNVPPQSVIDESIERSHIQPPSREPIILPDNPQFEPGTNTKNKYGVEDIYEDSSEELGSGNFGSVFKARHKHTSRHHHERNVTWKDVAIKRTKPNKLDYRSGRIQYTLDVEERCQEVRTLLKLREGVSPSISPVLYLHEYFWAYNKFNSTGDLFLVTELLGQDLDEWRSSQQNGILESTVKTITKELLNAIEFMHSRNVVHRDIKPQNVMFRKNGNFRTLKFVDFGLAKELQKDESLNDYCGSIGYMAPEILLRQSYSYEVDMFAFGVLLFRLISGERPFPSANEQKMRHDIINLRYNVHGNNWAGVSQEAKQMVRMLLIGREQRLTVDEARNQPWFQSEKESILNLEMSHSEEHVQVEGYNFSRAIAESHAPSMPSSCRGQNCYYVDGNLGNAINFLSVAGLFPGNIVHSLEGDNDELLCVEELPQPNAKILPWYIANQSRYSERECRTLCRKIAEIIKCMHDNGMAHRNIHLGNFMIDRWGNLLIRGLRHAQAVKENQPLTGHFGLGYNWYAFTAPEIDSELFHDRKVDLWSFGALIYMLLVGVAPFRGEEADLVTNKYSGKVEFDMVIPSKPAQELVHNLLQVDPNKRFTIEEVLESDWMQESDQNLAQYDLEVAHNMMKDYDRTR